MLKGYRPPQGKHNSLITGSPTDWSWGKGDHGSELDGLGDDDHIQYLINSRHDLTARHPAAVIGDLPASKIISGRFPVGRLPALTDEKIWKGTGGNVEEVDFPAGATLTVVDTGVFSDTAPTDWTDLDLSGIVGAQATLVILKVLGEAGKVRAFRKNGDTDNFYSTFVATGASYGPAAVKTIGAVRAVVMVATDTGGIIEWKCQAADTVMISTIAYIK